MTDIIDFKNKKYLDRIKKYVIKNNYSSQKAWNSMPKAEKERELAFQEKSMQYFINRIGPEWIESSKVSYKAGSKGIAVSRCVSTICATYSILTGLDLEWLKDEIAQKYSNTNKVEKEKSLHGRLVAELVQKGSSKKQAIDAISDWLNLSNTNIRNAYYDYCKTPDANEGPLISLLEFVLDICKHQKEFPINHPKAAEAFVKFGNEQFTSLVSIECSVRADSITPEQYFSSTKKNTEGTIAYKNFMRVTENIRKTYAI